MTRTGSDGTSTAKENLRVQRYVVLLGAGLLLVKLSAFLITDSVAIYTDAMESIVNVVAGSIGLYALYVSAKPRDRDHPYGHGKVEYISASIEGAMISFAGLLMVFEAVNRIASPVAVSERLDAGIALIAAAAVLNLLFGTFAVRKGTENRSQALVASGRHLRTDTLSSAGIIAGLAAMLALGGMGYDVAWLDGAIALVFGAAILMTGAKVLRSSFDGVMDRADNELLGQVVACLNGNRHNDWIDIHDLRIEKHGGMLHMDMHVTLPFMMTVREQYDEVLEVRLAVREMFGDSVELSITGEPCRPFCCSSCSRECPERRDGFKGLIEWTVENLSKDRQHACAETSN